MSRDNFTENNNIGKRIKEIRKKLKLSQAKFAKILDIKRGAPAISEWEKGIYVPHITVIRKICETFNVNSNWLLTGQGEMFLKPVKLEDAQMTAEEILKEFPEVLPVRPVPVISGQVPAGFPEMPLEKDQIIDYLYLPEPDIPKNSMAVKVKGNSMAPTIKDGDYVIFVPAGYTNVTNGDIVIVRNEWNELILKRFRMKNEEIYLTSDNPEYPVVKPNEEYKIVGKVIRKVTVEKV